METQVLTNDDFKVYRAHVDGWLKKFGISEWSVEYQHAQIGDRVAAQVQYDCRAKSAVFRLTKVKEGDYGMGSTIEELALHEVLHLLIADYGWTASTVKDDMADVVVSHEHELINRLMRVLKEK